MGRRYNYSMDYIRKKNGNRNMVGKANYNRIGLSAPNRNNRSQICHHNRCHLRKVAHLYDKSFLAPVFAHLPQQG